jgi:hypothetical protein
MSARYAMESAAPTVGQLRKCVELMQARMSPSYSVELRDPSDPGFGSTGRVA